MVDYREFIRNEETVRAIVFNGTKQMMLDIVRDEPDLFEIRSVNTFGGKQAYCLICKNEIGNVMKVKAGDYIVIDSLGHAITVPAEDFSIQYRGADEDIPLYDICAILASARRDNYVTAKSAWQEQYKNMARALKERFTIARR